MIPYNVDLLWPIPSSVVGQVEGMRTHHKVIGTVYNALIKFRPKLYWIRPDQA